MALRVNEDFRTRRPDWKWQTNAVSSRPFAYEIVVSGRRIGPDHRLRPFTASAVLTRNGAGWDVANEASG